ncbi:M24 family metallopeptidase [Candidatus Chlorohelix sp.]|uniref:M24 family metallopeptidase n=1 Tax=Candidatus Chlorohelix sp. TaxID=3139201 RepID=UPI00305E78C1
MAVGETQKLETQEKNARIRAFMERNGLHALVLGRQNNFAWATGGGVNWVNTAAELGAATLVYTASGKTYALTQNIEIPRFEQEEGLKELGFEVVSHNWWEGNSAKHAILQDLLGGEGVKVGTDFPLEGSENLAPLLARERWSLTSHEVQRFRELGRQASEALEIATAEVKPGMSEWEIAGRLAQECFSRSLLAPVTLVATDERIWQYRHPVPTSKKLEKYVMLVVCARSGGLVASCTRLAHFGTLTAELAKRHAAVQRIDAVFNLATRPGVAIGEVFKQGLAQYAREGFSDEWQLHHQGGATGYEARDYVGTFNSSETALDWQAFAWNPSITGTKSEDTILVSSEKGMEILTQSSASKWPSTNVEIEGLGTMRRPDILVL